MPKAHLFTLCWPGSLLEEDTEIQKISQFLLKLYPLINTFYLHMVLALCVDPPGFKLPERGVI